MLLVGYCYLYDCRSPVVFCPKRVKARVDCIALFWLLLLIDQFWTVLAYQGMVIANLWRAFIYLTFE